MWALFVEGSWRQIQGLFFLADQTLFQRIKESLALGGKDIVLLNTIVVSWVALSRKQINKLLVVASFHKELDWGVVKSLDAFW